MTKPNIGLGTVLYLCIFLGYHGTSGVQSGGDHVPTTAYPTTTPSPVTCFLPNFGTYVIAHQNNLPVDLNRPYAVDEIVYFKCHAYYELVGSPHIKCLSSGFWSQYPPQCNPQTTVQTTTPHARPCIVPPFSPPLVAASSKFQAVSPGSSVSSQDYIFYFCNNGLQLIGASQITCNNGYWSHNTPSCPKKCPEPIDIPHGTLVSGASDKYLPGHSITYKCDPDYILKGEHTLKCLSTGEWSAEFPTCENAHFCGTISPIENGYFQPPTSHPGSSVHYFCHPGFKLVGLGHRECLDIGDFDVPPPICMDIDECKTYPCDNHATCTNKEPGFKCKCNPGFIGDGFKCKKLACYPPVLTQYLTFEEIGQTKYVVDQVINYKCEPGYVLEGYGSFTATCRYDGSWFPSTIPSCKDKDECINKPCDNDATCTNTPGSFTCECNYGFIGDGFHCRRPQCNPPNSINHGDFYPKPNPVYSGQEINFHCFTGYEIKGEKKITCLIDGTWDHDQPTCEDKDECSALKKECHIFADCINTPGGFDCICQAGYYGDGIVCEENHSVCVGRPVPYGVLASTNAQKFDLYDIVIFSCEHSGFEIDGDAYSFCIGEHKWSSPVPTCRDINECEKTGICGDKAQCFNTDGSFECRCQQDHQMDSYGNCIFIVCTRPEPGKFGLIFPPNRYNFQLNEIITFDCKTGYQLPASAPTSAKCQSGGFDQQPSDCIDINECLNDDVCGIYATCINTAGSFRCECNEGYFKIDGFCRLPSCSPRKAPDGGSLTTTDSTWQIGTIVTFKCTKGFRLSGLKQIECIKSNIAYPIWDSKDPKCKDVDECTLSTPCPTNTICENNIGSFSCICRPGYVLDPYGFCKARTCPKPRAPDNGSFFPNDQLEFEQGKSVTYSCKPGFELQGSNTATCQENGQWSSPEPHCHQQQVTSQYCTVSGDPHYNTFDNLKYGFQGPCKYTLVAVTTAGLQIGLPNLVIVTENEIRNGLQHVTWLKKVFIHFNGNIIELRKHQIVLLNHIATELPINIPPISVVAIGSSVKVVIEGVLDLQYDGDHFLKVGLPSQYRTFVEGLCGDFNSIPHDDLRIAGTNQIATDIDVFGNSWQTNPNECTPNVHPGNTVCDRKAEYEQWCYILRSEDCFKSCHPLFDPIEHYENCVYDLCASNGDRNVLANSIAPYALLCGGASATYCDWRKLIQIELQCGPHSTYSNCSSACPITCQNKNYPPAICTAQCVEGCVCDYGYILSGTECVLPSECGCTHHGIYHKNNARFYTPGCNEHCHCQYGQVHCDYQPCGHGEKCVADKYGVLFCKPSGGLCEEKPLDKYIRIPKTCDDGLPINVGECPSTSCSTKCCGVVESTSRQLSCYGFGVITVFSAFKCGCVECQKKLITISGHVIEFHKVYNPNVGHLPGIHIKKDGVLIGETDQTGHFHLEVPHDVTRLVLTFFDSNNEFVVTTKVLAFNKFGGDTFHKIELLRKAPVIEKYSSEPAQFHLGEHNTVFLNIYPSSYFLNNGQSYNGKVFCRITLIDPKVPGHLNVASGDFTAEDGTSLRSYGMVDIDIRDEYQSPLEIKNVRIELRTSNVNDEQDKRSMRLWSLDRYSGFWVFERDAHLNQNNYGIEVVGSQFDVGVDRRQFNFDVPSRRVCFVKVRVFASNEYLEGEQLTGAKVTVVGADLTWRSSVSGISKPRIGVCLQTYCDVNLPARFSAELGFHEPLKPAPIHASGLSQNALNALYYSENGQVAVIVTPNQVDVDNIPGPFYNDEYSCLDAPFHDNHFRFFRQTSPKFEFNAIFHDEYNIYFTWQNSALSWYPSVDYGFQACYAKVNYISPTPFKVFAASLVDNGFVGTREDLIMGSPQAWSICLEYKCSTPSVATTVVVSSAPHCTFQDNPGSSLQTETHSTTEHGLILHFSPPPISDPSQGLYTAHASNPVMAKKIALASCYAGVTYADPKHVHNIILDQNVVGVFLCGTH